MGAADYPVIDNETLPGIIESEIARSLGQWDGTLSISRTQEFDYYYGRPFGNEIEGESQVVSTDVADTVEGILPIILNIFTSSDDAVRFDPNGPEDEDQAAQQTEVANYVFYRQNNGFLVLYEWFKDALIQKNGIVKYWWEDKQEKTKEEYQGLSEGEYRMLMRGEGYVEIEELEHKVYDDPAAIEARTIMGERVAQAPEQVRGQLQAALAQQPIPQLHDVKVRVVKDASKICIETVPPEEFGISANHNHVSIQDAPFCYHRSRKSTSYLRQIGCPEEIIANLAPANEPDITPEALARDRYTDMAWREGSGQDQIEKEVWVTDCFIRCDVDGDGIAELRHIIMPGRTIWINEETDHINFAAITPIIMPHRWVGRSVSELIMDIQFTKSVLWRQMLNNLYLTNNPRKAVLASAGGIVQANLDDLLTSRPGGIMREYVPNAIRNEEVPFVAGAAFPMLEYMDGMKETRTGVTRYSQGTDADSLNKMLDIHTEVPLADGSFKILRDVVDGDKLIGSDGGKTTVLKAHEVQNPEKSYRIVFASGDEIFSGGEHLWTVMTERDKLAGTSRTITADKLYQRLQDFEENVYIPRLQKPMFGGGNLPVDPYLLGCWLGDGTSAKSAITTMEPEIVEAFRVDGWNMYEEKTQNSGQAITWVIGAKEASLKQDGTTGRLVATGAAWLSKMGALGVARNKHIPDIYLKASYLDRLELLRGLMDTDGCHHSRSLVVFSQKKGRLLSDAMKLIEGLGGWPNLSEVDPGVHGKEGQTYWNVTFHLFDNPFKVARKALKWVAPARNTKTQPIVSMEAVDIRPMRCLTVDAADGLFCVGRRMTLTHNTARGIQMIQAAGQQRTNLIARIFAETGVKDLMRGIVYMLSKYNSKPMTLKLRNKWVDIDPRNWKTMFNMTVNVGLGTGNRDVQLAHLAQIHQQQIELMQSGKGYMVQDENLWNLFKKMQEAMGFKHPELFIADPTKISPQAKQPPPNPDMVKIQAEAQEAQAKLAASQQSDQLQAQIQKAIADLNAQTQIAITQLNNAATKEITQMKIAADAQLAAFEKGNEMREGHAEAQIKAQESVADIQLQREVATAKAQLAREEAEAKMALASYEATEKLKLEREIATTHAETERMKAAAMASVAAQKAARKPTGSGANP